MPRFAQWSLLGCGLFAVAGVVVPARLATAACNTLPPPPPPGGFKWTAAQQSARLLFRGSFGRISQPMVVPDEDKPSTFDVAPPDADQCAEIRGSAERCRRVRDLAPGAAVYAWLVSRATTEDDAVVVPLSSSVVSGTPGLITLRMPASQAHVENLRSRVGTNAAIVVSTAKTVPAALRTKPCADVAASDESMIVCIDSLCIGRTCDVASSRQPGLRILFRDNDFAALCRTDSTDPGGKNPKCDKNPNHQNMKLSYYLDERGDLSATFSWNRIRRCDKDDGSCRDDERAARELFGSIATTRFAPPGPQDGKPIRIPGPEFLGSTSPGDPGGGSGNPKRSKPFFDVVPNDPRKNELNLYGVTDKARSTLHLFRRYPVKKVCMTGTPAVEQACLGVNAGVETCACDDERSPRLCTCTENPTGRYYVCNGGPYPGEPCTRPSHCRDATRIGTCNGKPTCFDPATGPTDRLCTNDFDDEAPDEDKCPSNQFCGEGLFYLGHSQYGEWDYVVGNGTNPQTGVCENDDGEHDGDRCVGDCNGNVCAGYRLQVSPNP